MKLYIEKGSCIKCNKCVRICPAAIFEQDGVGKDIRVVNAEDCILCGHCVSVCPTESVCHSEFPYDKVHLIDHAKMPSPEQVMILCKTRRSNRSITSKPIPEESIKMILEAAHCVPTASNAQTVHFTLLTNKGKLNKVSEYTIGVFDKILKKLENPLLKPILKPILPGVYKYVPAFKRLKEEHLLGKDPILRHATALIFIHTPASNRFGCQDSNLAYQNASLMAESLGVSQIYMGFVLTAIKQDKKENALAKLLGIEGTIHAVMALGMPAVKYLKYADKKDIKVDIIS